MEAKDTVMSVREIAALLRGMPYQPSNKAGWVNFVRRCLNAQADISFKAGIKVVVDSFIEAEIHSNPNSALKAFYKVLKEWHAKLKELGLEEIE